MTNMHVAPKRSQEHESVFTIISVDDHIVEPPHLFEGRLPANLQSRAPRVIEMPLADGAGKKPAQAWEYEGNRFSQVGLNAVAGRDKAEYSTMFTEPVRFDEMRAGCYDIDARIRDMDLAGIWASVNFPSQISGFCGAVFAQSKDPVLGHAVLRAWNDWLYEEWWSPYPDRIVPLGLTWLPDAWLGAEEIRRNAARGFVAVSLPEQPHRIGLPSIYSPYWDPILKACEETDTTVCLHVGSSGLLDHAPDAPRRQLRATLFPVLSLLAAIDWVWAGVASRFPRLRIVMSEGGIGWVPMLLDRLDFLTHNSALPYETSISPAEMLRRNFFFCTLDDPSTLVCRERIGVDHIMVEIDYPHSDSTWPHSQALLSQRFAGMATDEIRLMTHLTASQIFRHPLPKVCLP